MDTTPPSGLTENVAGGLAYITIIPAIIFLLIEPYRRNSFVRFHCWQSIFFGVATIIIDIGFAFVPGPLWFIRTLISLLLFIVWLIAMINAFQGRRWHIPGIGALAQQQAGNVVL